MKAETKLNKILAMQDSDSKMSRLFSFCLQLGIQGTVLQKQASEEMDRLSENGFKIRIAGLN